MKAGLKYFIFGALSGILISGLMLVLFKQPHKNLYHTPQIEGGFLQLTTETDACIAHTMTGKETVEKIDINNASFSILDSLPGIGEVKAKSIVEFREKYGNFETVDELIYVPGIGVNLFQQICNLVFVNQEENSR